MYVYISRTLWIPKCFKKRRDLCYSVIMSKETRNSFWHRLIQFPNGSDHMIVVACYWNYMKVKSSSSDICETEPSEIHFFIMACINCLEEIKLYKLTCTTMNYEG